MKIIKYIVITILSILIIISLIMNIYLLVEIDKVDREFNDFKKTDISLWNNQQTINEYVLEYGGY